MTREAQELKLEADCEVLQQMICEISKDIKRVNKHRHNHMRGNADHHLKFKTMKEHVEALSQIMRGYIQDMHDCEKQLEGNYYRLQVLYAYDDEDEYLRKDAELSIRLAEMEWRQANE